MLYSIRNLVKTRTGDQGYRLEIGQFDVPMGARLAITGPSGCGKSTTLDILGLSLRPDSAEEFSFSPPGGQKTDVMRLWAAGSRNGLSDLRLGNMGYVLQSGELLPYLTCGENMTFAAELAGMAASEAEGYAKKLADRLDIGQLWKAMPATLSVGERQRAAIVRALACRPRVILADEPTAALDPVHADDVMDVFLRALDEFESSLILVTHNADWARKGNLMEARFNIIKTGPGATAILSHGARA